MKFDVERPVEYHTIKVDDTVIKVAEPKLCNVPAAYAHAAKQGGRLPSLGEASLIRYALFKKNQQDKKGVARSNEYMRPSTIAFNFRNDGSFNIDDPYLTAFTELSTDAASLNLVQAGYDANSNGKEFIVPVKDALICNLIAKAKQEGRVIPALTASPLELATEKINEKSAYGQNKTLIAMFGKVELAELNASYLSERDRKTGKVHSFTQKQLEKLLKGKEDHVLVRPCGLGGGNYDGVNANDYFDSGGWAWPVVHVGAQNFPQEK